MLGIGLGCLDMSCQGDGEPLALPRAANHGERCPEIGMREVERSCVAQFCREREDGATPPDQLAVLHLHFTPQEGDLGLL